VTQATVRKVEVTVCKTDMKLGLVFGYAIVCKVRNADGALEDYYDSGSEDPTDGQVYSDHITEAAMLEGVTEFMKSQRVATDMHERELDDDGNQVLDANKRAIPVQSGMVVHSMPLTTSLCEWLGIADVVKMTGWIVAMQPEAEMLKRFEDGTLRQFSIGGRVARQEETT
jgi:hypothetical protein